MILVTCSGIIGNSVYVNANFSGAVGSPDLLRILADPKHIPPGYLFAFLSSSEGRALIEQKTYGAVVPHIEAHHVLDLPIPRLDPTLEQRIHDLVVQAAQLRVEAQKDLHSVQQQLHQRLGINEPLIPPYEHARSWSAVVLSNHLLRLDAFFYTGYAGEALRHPSLHEFPTRPLKEIAVRVFNPPIFKRMYVHSDGVPYLMGAELYEIHPKATHFLSRRTTALDEYIIREGMIVVQDAGQRYGLLGTPIYANRTVEGCAATNNMIRIVFSDQVTAGYVYAFLNTDLGRRLILQQSYGSSLPHIFPPWLATIPIPWLDSELRQSLGQSVVTAFDKRYQANQAEDAAQALLAEAVELDT